MAPDRDQDHESRNESLVSILEAHAPLLHAIFQERCGNDCEDAFQAFVVTVLISRGLMSKLEALPTTDGQMQTRALLRKAASEFGRDWRRRRGARRRAEETLPPTVGVPRIETLSRSWARKIMNEALYRVHDHFVDGAHPDHWTAYLERVIEPEVRGSDPTPIDELCKRTSFNEPSEVYDAVSYVKRRLRHELIGLLLEHTDSDNVEELLNLFRDSFI